MGKVSQFFKNRYLVSQRDHVADDYQHSDFGRTYGWWVLLGGKRVASLEYRSFLEEPVHLYQVHVLDPAFSKIDQDPEKWASHDVVIESRYAEDYLKKGLEMAPVGKGMIVVQNLYVPEPYFKRQHDKVELFHDELLGNAKQSRSKKGSEELKEEDATEADSAPTPAPDKKTLAGAAAPAGQESSNAPAEEVAEEGSGDQDKEQKSLETQERVENKHQDREQRRLEREKIKLEKREQKRLEKEKAEQLKQEQLELERLEKERVAQAKLEQEKAEAERLENERIESERLEKMRLDQERQQQVLLEQERLNKQRLEQQVVEPPAVQQPIPQPPKFSSAEESWQSKLGGTPRQSHASQPSRGEGDAG